MASKRVAKSLSAKPASATAAAKEANSAELKQTGRNSCKMRELSATDTSWKPGRERRADSSDLLAATCRKSCSDMAADREEVCDSTLKLAVNGKMC